MLDGETVKATAARLEISKWTVDTYTKSIRRKLRVQSMAHGIAILLIACHCGK